MRERVAKEAPSRGVRILYETRFGGLCLRILSARWISRLVGAFQSSMFSRPLIKRFIKRHGIRMEEYQPEKYRNFNAFFTRRIKPESRPFDEAPEAFVSPCDGLVSVYPVTEGGVFEIKGFPYTLSAFLRDEELAKKFLGGQCVVIRLTVTDYHRYHFLDDGSAEESIFYKGKLHTVRPFALERRRVFTENCREVTLMHTEHFGEVAQVEVGAMMVGRIVNLPKRRFFRGEEKGRFEFGGSTIVLLIARGGVVLDEEFFRNTSEGLETRVKCGERIGTRGPAGL